MVDVRWHPERYQGARRMRRYFEGWYFQEVTADPSGEIELQDAAGKLRKRTSFEGGRTPRRSRTGPGLLYFPPDLAQRIPLGILHVAHRAFAVVAYKKEFAAQLDLREIGFYSTLPVEP
jgi:hypothetical protein